MSSLKRTHFQAKLAQKLKAWLAKWEMPNLPPLSQLSSQFDTSVSSMRHALLQLEVEGIIELARGRRARVVGLDHAKKEINKPTTAVAQVYDKLRDSIETGQFPPGRELPKTIWFTRSWHISDRTLHSALQQLQSENLVNKSGKHWFSGPEIRLSQSIDTAPCIFLLLPRENTWRDLGLSQRTRRFVDSFSNEAENNALRLIPVLTQQAGGFITQYAGRAAIQLLIRSLGNRYTGVLVCGRLGQIPDLLQWVTWLRQFQRPVVWFDSLGLEEEPLPHVTGFYKCRFSESNGLKLVLAELIRAGHKTVGYANHLYFKDGSEQWQISRGKQLEEINRNLERPLNIVRVPRPRELADQGNWQRFSPHFLNLLSKDCRLQQEFQKVLAQKSLWKPQLCSRLGISQSMKMTNDKWLAALSCFLARGYGPETKLIRELQHTVYLTPFISSFLSNKSVTAIIAPNDKEGVELMYWILAAGYQVPKQISILSFDNDPTKAPLPMDSIEFGFGYLGYAAFHKIFGDINISHNSKAEIFSRPLLVNRGTLAVL